MVFHIETATKDNSIAAEEFHVNSFKSHDNAIVNHSPPLQVFQIQNSSS